MPNDHFQWATQANVSIDQYDATKKWKIVARVRCEGNTNDGEALILLTKLGHLGRMGLMGQDNLLLLVPFVPDVPLVPFIM